MFLASFVLLTEVGFFGPGLVYLLATTVFVLLLFPDKKTKIPFFLTLAFCIFYGLLIQFNLIEVYSKQDIRVIEWIAISSNVLFMSAVLNLMIPLFLSKLESTLEEKLHLLESVRKTNIELNKYIAEVSAKNSELEQFAFIASHDLQEPLRMISSFMDKLKTKYEGQLDEKAQQYIFFASDGAKRMKQIILDLLIYSRASRHAEGKETVDLNELLYEFKGLRRIRISEKKATIISTKLPVLNTYKAAITQVLHGLLDNALKYAKPNTPPIVEIDVIENENEWEFAIKDNGIGIDSEFYEKIFVIFQRLHNRNEYEGTGIGLSVAKRHVEFLGGRIWLESSLEVGTTFYFSLPKNN
jgi:light-regulated signal transduction histidine kinase (bacteriophytochrome)